VERINVLASEVESLMAIQSDLSSAYAKYMATVQKEASILSSNFDRRKAAYVSARSTNARSGSLDMARLSEYKTGEDLFARTKVDPRGKNHSFFVLLDWSGSMHSMCFEAMQQAVIQATFLRKQRIKHDIMMFGFADHEEKPSAIHERGNVVMPDSSELVTLFHDTLSASEYTLITKLCFILSLSNSYNHVSDVFYKAKEVCNDLYSYARNGGFPQIRKFIETHGMGGTPLNAQLCELYNVMWADHVRNPSTQQNLMIISDGDSAYLNTSTTAGEDHWDSREKEAKNSFQMCINGKTKTMNHALMAADLCTSKRQTYGIISLFDWGVNKTFLFLSETFQTYHLSNLVGGVLYDSVIEPALKKERNKIINIKNLYGCIDELIYVALHQKSRRSKAATPDLNDDSSLLGRDGKIDIKKFAKAAAKDMTANPMGYLSAVLAEAIAVNYQLNKHIKSARTTGRTVTVGFDQKYWKDYMALAVSEKG
jgi:Mg-chelatase subunit ChlD